MGTTYTPYGSGWFQLSGTVGGISSSVPAGVQVQSGKTVYLDAFSLTCADCPSTATSTSSSVDVNHPWNYAKPITSGPHFVGTNSWQGSLSSFGVFLPTDVSTNDLNLNPHSFDFNSLVANNLPIPWSQGFNTYSEFYDFSAVSAFNGYPILTTDKPFQIYLSYDLVKLGNISPQLLQIAYLDKQANQWKLLNRPQVINWENHTIATTTTFLTDYILTLPSYQPPAFTEVTAGKQFPNSNGQEVSAKKTPETPVKEPTPPAPKPKTCFLWWCW